MQTLRTRVRDAIRGLRCPLGSVLCATYSSVDESFCNMENVLISDIPVRRSPQTSSRQGLPVVRNWTAPGASPPRAALCSSASLLLHRPPQRSQPLLMRPSSVLPSRRSRLRRNPMKSGGAPPRQGEHLPRRITGRFGLYVELWMPVPLRNVANIVKPLLDGVVCAMHTESQIDAEAVSRLAYASTWDIAEISKRLSDPRNPIISGPVRFLHHIAISSNGIRPMISVMIARCS